MAQLRDQLDAPNDQHHPNPSIEAPAGASSSTAALPGSRRERRALESQAAARPVPRASSPAGASTSTGVSEQRSKAVAVPRSQAVAAPRSRAAAVSSVAAPLRRRFSAARPTKRGLASTIVMTFAAGLIATMALPAYAFGSGSADFSANVSAASAGGIQTLEVGDTSAALAVSRDSYTAPTSEELVATRNAAAAAVAATEAASAPSSAAPATAGTFAVNPPSGSYSGSAVVDYAQQFVGVVPYSAGATPEAGFGCDGLTQYVFGQFGIYLPRIVGNQAAMGIRVAPGDAQPGDLVVWPMYHIGIYDGAGGVIDSPDWGRFVEHRALWGSYYFVRIV